VAVEVFANDALGAVTSGGTDAPAAGTIETWTVETINAFASASSATNPQIVFFIAEPLSETRKNLGHEHFRVYADGDQGRGRDDASRARARLRDRSGCRPGEPEGPSWTAHLAQARAPGVRRIRNTSIEII
jgi:hypothetical protein